MLSKFIFCLIYSVVDTKLLLFFFPHPDLTLISDPDSNPELIKDLDPNSQIISDPAGFRCTTLLINLKYNQQVLFQLLQNALGFSQIFLSPLAVVLKAVLKPHGSYKLLL